MSGTDPADLTLWPSPARRWLAVGILVALGGLLVALSGQPGGSVPARMVLALVGIGALAGGWVMARATRHGIVLDARGLCDTTGRMIAPLDQIRAVERGFLVFKPAGGFVLTLTEPGPSHWAPGLWWRHGRRVGIGGVTSAPQGRAMAELLSARIPRR